MWWVDDHSGRHPVDGGLVCMAMEGLRRRRNLYGRKGSGVSFAGGPGLLLGWEGRLGLVVARGARDPRVDVGIHAVEN